MTTQKDLARAVLGDTLPVGEVYDMEVVWRLLGPEFERRWSGDAPRKNINRIMQELRDEGFLAMWPDMPRGQYRNLLAPGGAIDGDADDEALDRRRAIRAAVASAKALSQELPGPGFDPATEQDARRWIERSIAVRQGQGAFREGLLAAYRGRCAISGTDVTAVLEAAHISPYRGLAFNHVTNGILLRADLHGLFDRFLVSVDPQTRAVWVAPSLGGTEYAAEYQGVLLDEPDDADRRPSSAALGIHFAVASQRALAGSVPGSS